MQVVMRRTGGSAGGRIGYRSMCLQSTVIDSKGGTQSIVFDYTRLSPSQNNSTGLHWAMKVQEQNGGKGEGLFDRHGDCLGT